MDKRIIKSLLFTLVVALLLSACAETPEVETPEPISFEDAESVDPDEQDPGVFKGRVIDLEGNPVSGAEVARQDGSTATTDTDGWFEMPADNHAEWLTVNHPEFISRTRGAYPNAPVLFRLTPDDGHTIVLHFVGDTMFGRRFFDPNEDGDLSDGILSTSPTVAETLDLLAPIQPLLENADLTVLNMESPLSDDPYNSPRDERATTYHSTKDYVFASYPTAALALKESGVDVIGLGNNHIYDLLDAGLNSTLGLLEDIGMSYYGAGANETEAWIPAVREVNGQAVAILGCTTIWRPIPQVTENDVIYVADGEDKGGAAYCQAGPLEQAVKLAVDTYDFVVVSVHGGYEYNPYPSPNVADITNLAKAAGADLVVNHHPHVVGGLTWENQSLIAWSMGNFLFDQTVWPTFESYLLAVYVSDSEIVRAYVEPLIVQDYIPQGVKGSMALHVLRAAAGYEAGPFVIENGAMEVDIAGLASIEETYEAFEVSAESRDIFKVPGNNWVSGFDGQGQIRLGRDLLWVGEFEDLDVDANAGELLLWDTSSDSLSYGSEYAFDGLGGIHLQRGSTHTDEGVTTNLHRILVDPGDELSLIGKLRASDNAIVSIQISWYPDTKGPSAAQEILVVEFPPDQTWGDFQFDLLVPENAVAVGVYFRLSPPVYGTAEVDFDNIYLVDWAAPEAEFSPLYEFFRLTSSGEVTFSKYLLP